MITGGACLTCRRRPCQAIPGLTRYGKEKDVGGMTILRSARVPAVLGLTVAGMLAVPLAAPASATTSHCLIINAAADTSYSSLQAAQNAASPGATLAVRGTCTGATEITKSLTLTGQHPAGFTAPTLSGGGQGSTLTIIGVAGAPTVTINTLTITGGTAGDGAGIFSAGFVTLNDSSITGNTARSNGGGIYAAEFTLTLNDTSITGNTAGLLGGGILNAGDLVTLNGSSSITGNIAGRGGGGIFSGGGVARTVGVTATNVTGNTPDNCDGTVPGCVG